MTLDLLGCINKEHIKCRRHKPRIKIFKNPPAMIVHSDVVFYLQLHVLYELCKCMIRHLIWWAQSLFSRRFGVSTRQAWIKEKLAWLDPVLHLQLQLMMSYVNA